MSEHDAPPVLISAEARGEAAPEPAPAPVADRQHQTRPIPVDGEFDGGGEAAVEGPATPEPAGADRSGLDRSGPDLTEPIQVPKSEDVSEPLAETALFDKTGDDPAGDGTGPESVSDPVPAAAAEAELTAIRVELAGLRAETEHVNAIADRLHAENERLRRGETEQLLQPLFRDLIKLADDWTGMATSWAGKDAATPQDVAKKCREVADDAEVILERHGVEAFSPEIGVAFERRMHRAVGSASTDDPALDGSVAKVRRPGYLYGEKVLRFAEVFLYKVST